MHNDDSVFTEIIVPPAGPLDEERSELPELPAPVVEDAANHSTAALVAIYSLIKAGYTVEDFS